MEILWKQCFHYWHFIQKICFHIKYFDCFSLKTCSFSRKKIIYTFNFRIFPFSKLNHIVLPWNFPSMAHKIIFKFFANTFRGTWRISFHILCYIKQIVLNQIRISASCIKVLLSSCSTQLCRALIAKTHDLLISSLNSIVVRNNLKRELMIPKTFTTTLRALESL